MRSIQLLPLALGLVASLSPAASAATLDVVGTVHCTDLTGPSWVGPTVMWTSVDSGTFSGTAQAGFATFADPALLTFSYGDLELDLTRSQSPGADTIGFEYYTELDSSVQPFEVRYNGVLWASGTTDFLRTEVDNSDDYTAVGTGRASLTAATVDGAAFFAEVLALTGGTGHLDFDISDFHAVDNAGNFASVGVMTAIPEPASASVLAGLGALALGALRRRRR